MRVVVLGAGIAGLTSAWYLREAGAEVTLVDRGAAPASETSHANGGHISTQSASPWTGPREVAGFFLSRGRDERAVRVRPSSYPQFIPWAWRALAASRPAAHRRAADHLLRLAAYSRECFDALVEEQQLEVALDTSGTLALYRSERAFARARNRKRYTEALSAGEVLAREPALDAARVRPVGGLHYGGDATGDCQRFCEQLAARLEEHGAQLHWDTPVSDLLFEGGRLCGVVTNGERIAADACVVALGAEAAGFLRGQRVRLPIIPLRGYTLTAPLGAGDPAPGRLVDAERHLVFARLGDRFRAAGMADFAGLSRTAPPPRLAQLERLARDWYPGMAAPEFWSCLRPITPDGPPVIGESGLPGVWLNAGLGPLGWTLACGAGRIVADLISGCKPSIETSGLTLARFS